MVALAEGGTVSALGVRAGREEALSYPTLLCGAYRAQPRGKLCPGDGGKIDLQSVFLLGRARLVLKGHKPLFRGGTGAGWGVNQPPKCPLERRMRCLLGPVTTLTAGTGLAGTK